MKKIIFLSIPILFLTFSCSNDTDDEPTNPYKKAIGGRWVKKEMDKICWAYTFYEKGDYCSHTSYCHLVSLSEAGQGKYEITQDSLFILYIQGDWKRYAYKINDNKLTLSSSNGSVVYTKEE